MRNFAASPQHVGPQSSTAISAYRSAVCQQQQHGAVHQFLQIHRWEEVLNERLAEVTLGKSVGDNEAKLSIWFEQTKAQIEERADEQIILVADTRPACAVKFAFLRIARRDERRVADNQL